MLGDSPESFRDYLNKINTIQRNDGVGTIDSVSFNLVHPNLSIDEWGLGEVFDIVLYVPGEIIGGGLGNPISIWFPWFGTYDENSLRNSLVRSTRQTKFERDGYGDNAKEHRKLTERQIDDILLASKPKYHVNAGDAIFIHNTVDIRAGRQYDLEGDAIEKHVSLKIRHSDGREGIVSQVLIIRPFQQIRNIDFDDRYFFVKLITRMMKHFKFKQLDDLKNSKNPSAEIRECLAKAYELYKTVEPAVPPESDDLDERDEAEELLDQANVAAMLGYHWAKFEIEMKVVPLVFKAMGRKGGVKSGKIRLKVAEEGWIPIAREKTKEARVVYPYASQELLAEEIRGRWTLEKPEAPGPSRLKDLIREMERSGDLPKRLPKPRAMTQRSKRQRY